MNVLLTLACIILTTFVAISGGWYTSNSSLNLNETGCADTLYSRDYFHGNSCRYLNRITLGDIDYYSLIDLLMVKSNEDNVVLKMLVNMSFSQEAYVGIKQVGPEKFVAFREKANMSIWNSFFMPLTLVRADSAKGITEHYSLGIQSDENLNGRVSKRVVDTAQKIKDDHKFATVYTSREIDLPTVILLAKVWSHSLRDVGKSTKSDCPSVLDGAGYLFSSRQCRGLRGYVANPDDSSRTGKLVDIGYSLSHFVNGDSTKNDSSLLELRHLSEIYLQ